MRRTTSLLPFLALALIVATLPGDRAASRAADDAAEGDKSSPLAHSVYFTLNEGTAANRKALVASCKKHLTKHEGELYFTVGTLAEDLKAKVNDRDFDVALTIVFKSKAAHDKYQTHKRHLAFIKENKELFKSVRVFDSYNPK
jgi:hypothetical protein